MKKNEVIELNGVEYTLELNRDSFLKIDQYSNLQKSMDIIQEDLINYVDEIDDDTNPFEEELNDETIQKKMEEKMNVMKRVIERAFWIWLYPNHKLNITQIKEVLMPYFNDDDKFQWISDKYADLINKCVAIRNDYIQEQKNLKAQINKKK